LSVKNFLKNIEAMVNRAFDRLCVEYPNLEVYTVLIYIDFEDATCSEITYSKATCSVGFDDLQNSLKCAEIWAASLHPKDEADRSDTRTYQPKNVLLSEFESVECDSVNIKDVISVLKNYKASTIDIAVNTRVQELHVCKDAKLVIEFKQWWLGRSIRNMIDMSEAENDFTIWKRLFFVLIILFLIYKLFF
jgi:hypothetical protein